MATADGTTKDSRTASAAMTRPTSRSGRIRCVRTDLRLVASLLLMLIYPVALPARASVPRILTTTDPETRNHNAHAARSQFQLKCVSVVDRMASVAPRTL